MEGGSVGPCSQEEERIVEDVDVDFDLVSGEVLLSSAPANGGRVVLTNFRLHYSTPLEPHSLVIVPIGLIEWVELRELIYLHVFAKNGRLHLIQMDNLMSAEEWLKKINEAVAPPARFADVFAFTHCKNLRESSPEECQASKPADGESTWFSSEIARLRFDLQVAWRVSHVNKDHKLCPTYPEKLLIPHSISDADLVKVGSFRSARRIPSVVFRHVGTGAVMARCSQPEVGWLGWRSPEDEKLVRAISDACAYDRGTLSAESSLVNGEGTDSENNSINNGSANNGEGIKDLSNEVGRIGEAAKVLLVDARSYAAAWGNRARGGGVECEEYYGNTEIVFMNLANIHSVRKSFHALRALLVTPADQASWFSGLDSSKWLSYISSLLKASVRCARALEDEGRPVLVHCSDGWDRTPQVCSLTQILLDPYYRTMEGFQLLIEKEWLDHGHKMADRCGNAPSPADANERSPIFLQWLDCVHQLLRQFPCHFEFNGGYLVKLATHVYSQMFGTFLCNSQLERRKAQVEENTLSVFEFLKNNPAKFRNYLHSKQDETLRPKCELSNLLLWRDVYVSAKTPPGSATPASGNASNNGKAGKDKSSENSGSGEVSPVPAASDGEENEVNGEAAAASAETQSDDAKPDEDASSTEDKIEEACSEDAEGDASVLDREDAVPPSVMLSGNLHDRSTDTLVPEVDVEERNKAAKSSAEPEKLKLNSESHDCCLSAISPKKRAVKLIASENLLDSDGLPSLDDPVQERMHNLIQAHQEQVQTLTRDLCNTRRKLRRHASESSAASAGHLNPDPAAANSPGLANGIPIKIEGNGTASDLASSWETLDESEVKPANWSANGGASAALNCRSCQIPIWAGKRKYNCRQCARFFCRDCSDNFPASLTAGQPGRVCGECYRGSGDDDDDDGNVSDDFINFCQEMKQRIDVAVEATEEDRDLGAL